MVYTKDEKVVDRALRSAYLGDLEELEQALEAADHDQLAVSDRDRCVLAGKAENARVLSRFLGLYLDRCIFELIQMDTDNNYINISADRLEDLRYCVQNFEATKRQWLAYDSRFFASQAGGFNREVKHDVYGKRQK